MKAYMAFTKKEFCGCLRTYKLLIILIVFTFIGMISPITAKIMPDIIDTFMPDNIHFNLPEPTALDAWAQFYKNMTQMGLIILVIMFSGIMTKEYHQGTLIHVLTKGLPRHVVILSKFSMTVVLWTVSYLLCFIVTYAYTLYFWSNDTVTNLIFSVMCLWVFGILLLALLLLGGVLFNNTYGSLLFTGGLVVVLMMLNLIQGFQKYNPINLTTHNMSLLKAAKTVSDFIPVMIVSSIIILLSIIVTMIIFNKKQL